MLETALTRADEIVRSSESGRLLGFGGYGRVYLARSLGEASLASPVVRTAVPVYIIVRPLNGGFEMSLNIAKPALAFVLPFLFAGTGVIAGEAPAATANDLKFFDIGTDQGEGGFKLKAGGQLGNVGDIVTFAGQASYLGQFTANGTRTPFLVEGTMTAASGDVMNYYFFFREDPPGQLTAYFHMIGGTGRLYNGFGEGHGPATVDEADGMFTLSIEGRINFWHRLSH